MATPDATTTNSKKSHSPETETAAVPKKKEGIDWSVRNVPYARRRETASMVFFTFTGVINGWAWCFLCCYLTYVYVPFGALILAAYLTWSQLIDTAPNGGGRAISWIRSWVLWKWYSDFFPASLRKTCDLDPARRYIFGYHPHGIISLGVFSNFAVNIDRFQALFPGIAPLVATLSVNFFLPFHREWMLANGLIDVSRESIRHQISPETAEPGSAVVIVVGGAQESLDALPGTSRLTLNKRKGFVKIALRHGASLVPVFSFGENNIYDQILTEEGSRLAQLQQALKRVAGFTLPLFKGRGVFQRSFGILPHRKPIVSVVGAPVHCPRTPQPSQEDIDKYHALYVAALTKVYNDHKDELDSDRKEDLSIIA